MQSPPANDSPFFLPDLCQREAVVFVVLVALLFALILVLVQGALVPFDWPVFAMTALYVLWVALASAATLCRLRPLLQRLPQRQALLGSYAIIPAHAWLAAAISRAWLQPEASAVGPSDVMPADSVGSWLGCVFAPEVLKQVLIAAIVGGLVIRQFHLQASLLARRQSELLLRLQALQSRIRPHFLFNSMNIIASLIATRPDTAERVVEDLALLFRASLNEVGNEVPLAEELDLCRKFLNIEQLRLGERLEVQWDVREIPAGVRIPLLTLQPILENAVVHGIQPNPGHGVIEIIISHAHGLLEVVVTNPCGLQGVTPEPTEVAGNRMALINIRHRIQTLYGPRAGLTGYQEGQRYITRLSYPFGSAQTGVT